jgi:undecaprenyl-diphosphatase
MVEKLLNAISALGHWGYLFIFLAPLLESSAFLGLIIPGETVVLLAGFLSSQGYLDLGDCIVVIALGAILGDSIGYELGKSIGKKYFETHDRIFLFKKKHLQKVETYFARYGGATVFWGRLVHLLRAMAPFTAGMSEMPYRKFLLYNAAGGTLWAVIVTLVGYFFGQSWQLIDKWIGRAGVFVLFMVLIIFGFGYLYKKLADNKEAIFQLLMRILNSPQVIRFEQKYPKFVSFIVQRLSPGSYLGLHLTVGLSISAVFVWIFGGIVEDVIHHDPLVMVDQWVVGRVLYFRSQLTTSVMKLITQLGGAKFIAPCSLLVILFLILKKYYYRAAGFTVAVIGGSLLNSILKVLIHRLRPISETTLISVYGWSFPSGHAMSSVIFYGMITYFLIKATDSWKSRSFFIVTAVFVATLIGFSRIYLQVHYLSDVLAGFAGGLFWLSVCITGLELYDLKRKIEMKQAGK